MRGNIIIMRVPSSSSKKIYLHQKIELKDTPKNITSLSPKFCNLKLKEYLKKPIPTPPIFNSSITVKFKAVIPKSFQMMPTQLDPKSDTVKSQKLRKAKSCLKKNRLLISPTNIKNSLSNLTNNEIFSVAKNDSFERLHNKKSSNPIGSISSTIISNHKSRTPKSIKSDLKYLLNSTKIFSPSAQTRLFNNSPQKPSLLPHLKRSYNID